MPMLDRQDNVLLKLTSKSSLVQTDIGGKLLYIFFLSSEM